MSDQVGNPEEQFSHVADLFIFFSIECFFFQSNTSEVTLLDSRVDSVDSQDENIGHSWNRNNSVSL